jgi:hypothetical protein
MADNTKRVITMKSAPGNGSTSASPKSPQSYLGSPLFTPGGSKKRRASIGELAAYQAEQAAAIAGDEEAAYANARRKVFAAVIVLALLLCMLGVAVAVIVISADYMNTSLQESETLVVGLVTREALANLNAFLAAKTGVSKVLTSMISSGTYSNFDYMPSDDEVAAGADELAGVAEFEKVMLPLFLEHDEFLAIYQANYPRRKVLKFHREDAGYIGIQQRRFIANATDATGTPIDSGSRRGLLRPVGTDFWDVTAANFSEWVPKSYDPFAKGWYITGAAMNAGDLKFEGPVKQTYTDVSGASAFNLIFKAPIPAGGHSVFKFKFLTASIVNLLRGMEFGEHGSIHVVGDDWTVVASNRLDTQKDGDFYDLRTGDSDVNQIPDDALDLTNLQGTTAGGIEKSASYTTDSGRVVTVIQVPAAGSWRLITVTDRSDYLLESAKLFTLAEAMSVISLVLIGIRLIMIIAHQISVWRHVKQFSSDHNIELGSSIRDGVRRATGLKGGAETAPGDAEVNAV